MSMFVLSQELYFNSSHTHKGSLARFFFVTPQGDFIPESFVLKLLHTNDIAKYEGLITSLKTTIQWNIREYYKSMEIPN